MGEIIITLFRRDVPPPTSQSNSKPSMQELKTNSLLKMAILSSETSMSFSAVHNYNTPEDTVLARTRCETLSPNVLPSTSCFHICSCVPAADGATDLLSVWRVGSLVSSTASVFQCESPQFSHGWLLFSTKHFTLLTKFRGFRKPRCENFSVQTTVTYCVRSVALRWMSVLIQCLPGG